MPIAFYSLKDPYGNFSNFARYAIDLDGQTWPSTEHYFQAQKFEDPAYRERVRAAETPRRAAELGRSREAPLRADWEQIKDDVMYRAVRQKFLTYEALRAELLSTGEELLIEDAPEDYYWGCGKDGSGLNRLGEILVRVRAELRAQGG